MQYGIANVRGKPTEGEALEIVNAAWTHGMRFFDTAQAYGDSKKVLGRAFRSLGFADQVKVVSKLSPEWGAWEYAG
jgi:spore coat polysaccharide biosynthesis protein SpsF